jgi:hypothetical protein
MTGGGVDDRGAGGDRMVVCVRTVRIPAQVRDRFLAWIEENRAAREEHGILFELVLERSARQNPAKTLRAGRPVLADGDEATVITAWASHDAFDAWIDTPERDRLTASEVHGAVEFGPITRHDVVGGYLNLDGISAASRGDKEAPS